MTPLIPTSFIYPLLSGETCREVAKQTAGVSLADEDAQITRQLDNLVLTWNKLSQSILLDYVDEYIFSPSHEGGREEGVERASWNDRSPASSAHPTGSPPSPHRKKRNRKRKPRLKQWPLQHQLHQLVVVVVVPKQRVTRLCSPVHLAPPLIKVPVNLV